MSKPEDGDVHHVDVADFESGSDEVDQSAIGGRDISELPPHYFRSFKFIGTVVAFAIGSGTATAVYPMMAGAVSFINADVGPSNDIIWVILSFTLCQSISYAIVGRLGDLFGRRWFFIGANLTAFVGFLIAGRAKSVNTVIGANVLSGIGTAAQLTANTVLGEFVPNNQRFLLYSVVCCGLGPLIALSPGLGRVFCVNTEQSWRWIFYLGAINSFIVLVLVIICYYPPTFESLHKHETKKQVLKRFDYIGMILYSGSSASLLLGLSWGGQRFPWRSAQVIVTLVVGGLGYIVLLVWEHLCKLEHPFFSLSTLTNRNWAMMTICSCVGSMIFYALNILWVEQLVILFQLSPSRAGWAACSLTGGVIFGWTVAPAIIHYLPKRTLQYQLIVSTLLITAFIGAEASANGSNLAMGVIFSLIGSFGIGYLEIICIVGGPLHIPAKDLGLANGLQMSLRTVTSSLASAIFVTILSNEVSKNVPSRIVAAAMAGGLSLESAAQLAKGLLLSDSAAIAKIPGITPAIITAASKAAQRGYFVSFQVVYYVSLAFGIFAIAAACSVDGKLMESKLTGEVARRLRKIGDHPSRAQEEESGERKAD